MTVQPLYVIANDIAEIVDALIDNNGEANEAIEAQLNELHGDFADKLARCGVAARNIEAEMEKHKAEARRQANRAAVLERSLVWWKDYCKRAMIAAGETKIPGAARIQANSRPSILWTRDAMEAPEAFRRVTYSVDGDAAYDYWKEHKALPDGFDVQLGSHIRFLV